MEQHLPGGFINAVVRVGDTIRRPHSPDAAFAHDLLMHLERRAWPAAHTWVAAHRAELEAAVA
jgi:hypothetical protein